MARILELDDLQDGYIELVNTVKLYGVERESRNGPTIDLADLTVVLNRPQYATPVGISRNINLALASAETTHLTAGISDAAQLSAIAPVFKTFMNGDRLLGAYGPRIRNQLPQAIKTLASSTSTRQAAINIWREDELERENADVPCTIMLGWFVRNGKLDMNVAMRSSDVFLGVPYDFTMFTRLQLTLAWALGMEVGRYTHLAWSCHIYKRDLEKLSQLVSPKKIIPSPVPAYGGSTRHDSAPGERSPLTALDRFMRARTWAQHAMLATPVRSTTPDHVQWHIDKLAPWKTGSLYCSVCHYVLPRTVDNFYSHNRANPWKARCRHCVTAKRFEPAEIRGPKQFAARCARYGVTPEWFNEQLERQKHVCGICQTKPDNGRYRDFVIDHDHETGQVRGLLCSNCNQGLGLFADDTARISRAKAYLLGEIEYSD